MCVYYVNENACVCGVSMYMYMCVCVSVSVLYCPCVPTESLAEFIAHHTVDKLCLPCKLVLPKSGGSGVSREGGRGRGGGGEGGRGRGGGGEGGRVRGGGDGADAGAPPVRRRPVTMQEALKTGAGKACCVIVLCVYVVLYVVPVVQGARQGRFSVRNKTKSIGQGYYIPQISVTDNVHPLIL